MAVDSRTAMAGDYAYGSVPTDDDEDQDSSAAEAEKLFQRRQELLAEVTRLQNLEEQAQKQLDGLNRFWGNKVTDHEQSLQEWAKSRKELEEELQALDHPHEDGHTVPPGPKSLYWVRGNRFTAVCSAVVITNLITMFMEMAHPHYKDDFFILDQVVLVFYISEIVLKALLFRKELFIGPCSVVWWNWLDLVIVLVGILDQWVQPCLVKASGDSTSKHSTAVQAVKMLRLARLARILKTVRAFMESDLSWAEGKRFQLFIMGTIAANSLIMSFESDIPDWGGWFYVEQVLLIIFSFELLVRLRHWGCRFFYHDTDFAWNWLDFVIVVGGIIDQWMMPMMNLLEKMMGMKPQASGQMGEIMTTLRMARLLRILRLVRLVKNIPPLFTLIVGILQAMQGMAWVLVLTAVFLYAFALLAVRLIGHGLVFGGRAPPEIAEIFPTVPQAMFVLFKVMNGDTEPLEPVFYALPIMKLVVVLYMVVSSWAILSILTAVVSENMIQATEHHREELEEEMQATKEVNTREYLSDIFAEADKDGSGELGDQEFAGMLADETTLKKLIDQTRLEKKDLTEVFELLLLGDDNKVSRDVFIEGLQNESRAVTERSVFRLEKRLIDLQKNFQKHLDHVAAKEEKDMADEERKLESILGSVSSAMSRKETQIESSLLKIAEKLGVKGLDLEELRRGQSAADLERQVSSSSEPTNLGSAVDNLIISQSAPVFPVPRPVEPQRSGGSVQEDLRPALSDLRTALSQQLAPLETAMKQLPPLEEAMQRIETRLDSIALESNLQRIESSQRIEASGTNRQDSGCDAILARLGETLVPALSKHMDGMQLIFTKVESHLELMRDMPVAEPLMRKLEYQLQAHQQSSSDALYASLDMSQNMSQTMSQTMRQVQSEFACLIGKYEQRLQAEMNRVLAAIQTWSSVLHQGFRLESSPAPSWTQPYPENLSMSSTAAPFLNIDSIVEESEQVPGLTTSARGATGGTLE